MGILRNTLIIGGLAIALPAPPPLQNAAPQAQGSAFAYIAAAADTFADVRSFCERKPGVCLTAGHIAQVVEAKAKYSAKLIYEWANEATAQTEAASSPSDELAAADPMATGSASLPTGRLESQSTLKLEDLLPEWQEPGNPGNG